MNRIDRVLRHFDGLARTQISRKLAVADTTVIAWNETCATCGLKLMEMKIGHAPNSLTSLDHGLHFEDCRSCLAQVNAAILPPCSVLPPAATRLTRFYPVDETRPE